MTEPAAKTSIPFHPAGIFFDMDGVILDSMKYHEAAWREVLRSRGVSVEPEDIYRREGMSGITSVQDIFIDKNHPVPDESEIEKLIAEKHALFRRNKVTLFAGVAPLLTLLHEKEIILGLVTGSHFHTVEECLPPALGDLFSVIVTADDVSEGKPAPEPYLKAVSKAGLLPGEVLVVENAPMGVASARSAGIYCIAIETTLPKEFLTAADQVVKNHDELTALFRQL